jgi:hypothetical protein
MKTESRHNRPEIEIAELYPSLNAAELQEAAANLEGYLEIALRIYERIRGDPESYQQFKLLTQPNSVSSMHSDKVEGRRPTINPSQT